LEPYVSAAWVIGMAAWIAGMYEDAKLRRRHKAKTGRDLHPIDIERYLQNPLRWLREGPGVAVRMMRTNSAALPDAELERIRLTARRWYGIGVACLWLAIALFLVSLAFPSR
jgi:hypothetical protein